jgi:myo-inositol-1(or 4)-monophosphatase
LPASDLALLCAAAREAGALALRHAQHTPKITEKPDGAGPVTDADLAVDALLKRRLLDARPHYGWLSEETPDTPHRLGPERTFIVDPIDGTRAFIEGSGDWAHSLAIADNGVIVAAAVYLPMKKALFAARLGGGATLNDAPILVSRANTPTDANILTAKATLDPTHWAHGTPPPFVRKFRSSLAWRLCLVAEGAFDGMLTLRPSWEWDIAAGALIVTEAGGMATDRTGATLRFNNPHPQTDGVIAAPPGVHAGLRAALA